MMYPVICNISSVYRITKLLLNFSSVNSSKIDVLGENLVDAARSAKSTFIMGQYNIALGKIISYTYKYAVMKTFVKKTCNHE